MADFVTKKENTRRLMILVFCCLADLIALLVGIYAIKGASDVEEKGPNSISALTKVINEKRDSNRVLEENYIAFSRQVGFSRLARGTADTRGSVGVNGPHLQSFLDSWVKDRFTAYGITGVFPSEPAGEGEVVTLMKLLDKLSEKEADYRLKIGQLQTEVQAARTQDDSALREIISADDALLNDIDKTPGGLREEAKRLLKQHISNEKAHSQELDGDGTPANRGLSGEMYDKQAALTDFINNMVRVKTQLAAQKRDLENRINWIIHRQEEAKERKEPDGEILAVYPVEMVAYIDLVHADRIHRGSIFKVYSLEKGGVKIDKGTVEVLEVGREGYSRVAMYPAKAEDPIKRGDRIYDEYYERGKPRTIAFAGRLTGKLSNEEAVKALKAFGDFHQDKVDERTNYVVVGEGYEDHPNFKLAQEWGVKILLERAFYEYLGIP